MFTLITSSNDKQKQKTVQDRRQNRHHGLLRAHHLDSALCKTCNNPWHCSLQKRITLPSHWFLQKQSPQLASLLESWRRFSKHTLLGIKSILQLLKMQTEAQTTNLGRHRFAKTNLNRFRILRFRAIDLLNLKTFWWNCANCFANGLLQQSKMVESTEMQVQRLLRELLAWHDFHI